MTSCIDTRSRSLADEALPDALHLVGDYLENRAIAFEYIEKDGLFHFDATTDRARFRILLAVGEDDAFVRVGILVLYPVRIPEARRPAVAEAIQRIGFGLISTVPELDMDTGELRIKTPLMLSRRRFDSDLLHESIGSTVEFADRCLAALFAVGFGNVRPGAVSVTAADSETSSRSLLH